MKMEIERKFLVVDDGWRSAAGEGIVCEQGYLASTAVGVTVRVRRMGRKGFLTIKGPTTGFSRTEMEYEIPEGDAEHMIKSLCGDRVVLKRRYHIEFGGSVWEVDEFSGLNQGLVLAEIELGSEAQSFERPDWLGEEVSHDPRYFNAALAENPISLWY